MKRYWGGRLDWSDVEAIRRRLLERCVVADNGCWEWQGALQGAGYGYVRISDKNVLTHRAAAVVFNKWYWAKKRQRRVSKSLLVVMHSCDNRRCCNPDHLTKGIPKDNSRDCLQKGRTFKFNITHCPHGHSYDESNTRFEQTRKGYQVRRCRTCRG